MEVSPRKQNLTLYIKPRFDQYESSFADLGKFKTGKSCLYINNLEDIDNVTLKELIQQSVTYLKNSS
ncbi:MAG: DUF1801 domain-containing protein [Candidatus Thorarchaeota archaeon]